ncbi:hypothetical protein [Natrinema pallidum]|uniref:hypothetical protein n=1 Tax=Natrinema pallidum TaxID=69527 RepID=UPI001586D90D|nr:hypothetical protein [Natrinema pallidum]
MLTLTWSSSHLETYGTEWVSGASRHWHLLMLADSLLEFGAADSARGPILERATALRNDIKRSVRERVQNLLT